MSARRLSFWLRTQWGRTISKIFFYILYLCILSRAAEGVWGLWESPPCRVCPCYGRYKHSSPFHHFLEQGRPRGLDVDKHPCLATSAFYGRHFGWLLRARPFYFRTWCPEQNPRSHPVKQHCRVRPD